MRRLEGKNRRDTAAEQGEQTGSDVEEKDGASQQDVPHPWSLLWEMAEITASRKNSCRICPSYCPYLFYLALDRLDFKHPSSN